MLGIAVLVGAAGLALLLFGNPLRAVMMLVTSRNALVGLMIAVGVVGVLWALQVLAANLAQSTKERLEGTKRYIALGVAALMMVAVALPFGRGEIGRASCRESVEMMGGVRTGKKQTETLAGVTARDVESLVATTR